MSSGGPSACIRDHGVVVDKKKSRVRCNYCRKEMENFTRLKHHLLGRHLCGLRTGVTPCKEVPDHVRETFLGAMLAESLSRKGSVTTPPPHRRVSYHEDEVEVDPPAPGDHSGDVSLHSVKRSLESDGDDLLSKKIQKCIGRFFFENGFDVSAVESGSFREMLSAVISGDDDGMLRSKMPSAEEMQGWIFEEERKTMEESVRRIKDSWANTGCSILLDAWVDMNGRDFISFLVDCPMGPVYLKSHNISDLRDDMISLATLVDEVVEEVGSHNVVQIISCSVSGWLGRLRKWYVHHRQCFWSVSVSCCFEHMLEMIAKIDVVSDVLNKVKSIAELIHNDPSILKLFRDHNHGHDLAMFSKNDITSLYLTLESIVMKEKVLEAMFVSSAWKNSTWASRDEGISVAKLVKQSSFWKVARTVMNCTIGLVQEIELGEKLHAGAIYERMDDMKESIKQRVHNSDSGINYEMFWGVIDQVWDAHLYSPLHAAGYFLNPHAKNSHGFLCDAEVSTGLLSCVVYMVKDHSLQRKILPQFDLYRLGKDSFSEGSRADKLSRIDPDEWWNRYGGPHPELQRMAIKIMSQTCEGASRYRLKWRVAEELLVGEKAPLELKLAVDFAFVHYNLQLQRFRQRLPAAEDSA